MVTNNKTDGKKRPSNPDLRLRGNKYPHSEPRVGCQFVGDIYVHPGKWLQSGRPSTLVGVIPRSSRNTAVLIGRKKMW